MQCFYFPFPVQFSVNILKKLNIQSSSIMQLVKTAAETLQCIPNIEMKRCKKTNLKVKEMLSEVSKSVFMRCQKVVQRQMYSGIYRMQSRKDCGQMEAVSKAKHL